MKRFLIFIFCFLLLSISNVYAEEFNIYSDNAILYNIEEDKILYEKEPEEKVQIASMTKVMTALVVLDHEKDLNKEISFKDVDFDFIKKEDLSISTLDSDRTYTYKEFLYSFILESSADCGYALALDVGKTNKNFSKLMNDKAKELGMNNSKFNNPIGLDDEKNHYSTMNDMLTLMKAALNNETLKEIMSTMKYKIDGNYIYHTIYGYQKKFDLEMPYLVGGKTGFNTIPGYALASFAERLHRAQNINLEKKANGLSSISRTLNGLSPLSILGRGYSAVYSDKKIVKSIKDIEIGDKINIKTADGTIDAEIINTSEADDE